MNIHINKKYKNILCIVKNVFQITEIRNIYSIFARENNIYAYENKD